MSSPQRHTITKASTRSDGPLRICRVFEIHLWLLARTADEPPLLDINLQYASCTCFLPVGWWCQESPGVKQHFRASYLAPHLGCQGPNKCRLPHAQKLGRSGKSWARILCATSWLGCVSVAQVKHGLAAVCHGLPPPRCWDLLHFCLVLLICFFPGAAAK